MKKTLITISLILGSSFSYAKEDANPIYKTKAEMFATHQLECSDIKSLSPEYSPADLYNAAAKCIQEENFDAAFKFISVAGVYENYDFRRVQDTQNLGFVKTKMKLQYLSNLPQNFKTYIMINSQGEKKQQVCDFVKKIEAPKYHPYYITAYGQSNSEERELKSVFNSNQAYIDSLNKFLLCNYEFSDKK